MATTPRAVKTEIENLLTYLIDTRLGLYANPVVERHGRVTWSSVTSSSGVATFSTVPTVGDYRQWLLNRAYTVLLSDGSLLQVTYEFAAGSLVRHRLAYVPCPYDFDKTLLAEESPVDVLDAYTASNAEVLLRTMVRFDYDIDAARPGHPAAHLTLNTSDCRIACAAPLGVRRFIDFVFRHFYPVLFADHRYLTSPLSSGWGEMTLKADEAATPHLSWDVLA